MSFNLRESRHQHIIFSHMKIYLLKLRRNSPLTLGFRKEEYPGIILRLMIKIIINDQYIFII